MPADTADLSSAEATMRLKYFWQIILVNLISFKIKLLNKFKHSIAHWLRVGIVLLYSALGVASP